MSQITAPDTTTRMLAAPPRTTLRNRSRLSRAVTEMTVLRTTAATSVKGNAKTIAAPAGRLNSIDAVRPMALAIVPPSQLIQSALAMRYENSDPMIQFDTRLAL